MGSALAFRTQNVTASVNVGKNAFLRYLNSGFGDTKREGLSMTRLLSSKANVRERRNDECEKKKKELKLERAALPKSLTKE